MNRLIEELCPKQILGKIRIRVWSLFRFRH